MLKRCYLSICGIVLLAALVMLASKPWITYTINLTHSLPGRFYVVLNHQYYVRGDLIAFRWHGGLGYPAGAIFIKQLGGLPGDLILRDGRRVWISGRWVGEAKTTPLAGQVLTPADSGEVPADHCFVMAPHPDSLDSRYQLFGTIHKSAILGPAYAIF